MYNTLSASPLLFLFLKKYNFDLSNLDKVNVNGVTPLTLAVENDQFRVVRALLNLDANPLVENIHGNTALKLAIDKPFCRVLVKQAIKLRSCGVLNCKDNTIYYYGNKPYKITKILPGGSCSLAVFELQDQVTSEKYIAKIKPNVGGLEIRNYIFLDKYIDLFIIENLITASCKAHNVYCLVQKIVAGEAVTNAINRCVEINDKINIIFAVIKSLCELHKKGYIHNDALPDNCYWDDNTQQAEFIDYDVMRTKTDLDQARQDWQEAEYLDLKRLIIGDTATDNIIYGLMQYTNNIHGIIEDFKDTKINPVVKQRLLASF
ncbi:MAG: ankyrin repeat domain-containing protein [Gammaproteobacteria bacterium]